MPEINLLQNYPKTKRDLKKRSANRTEEDRLIARKFDKDFFGNDQTRIAPVHPQGVAATLENRCCKSSHDLCRDFRIHFRGERNHKMSFVFF